MEREHSDEEEDRETLVSQNARSNDVLHPANHRRSSFQIDDFKDQITPNSRKCNKRYLFAAFLPMVILVLFFTTDLKNLFQTRIPTTPKDLGDNPSVNRMRESELRALYLLKQQEIELFKTWNRTALMEKLYFDNVGDSGVVNRTSVDGNDNKGIVTSSMLEDLKSRAFSQISLNKQIQGVLLSSHENGDYVNLTKNYTDASFGDWSRCGKVDQRLSERKTIEWKPKSNKYLFAICTSGQVSNHLICLEKHMLFAALLNRVLVIPSAKVDYDFHRLLDIEHINKCVERKVVVTFEELLESKKNVHINKFLCYFSLPQPCFVDDDHVKKLKGLGLTFGKIEAVWKEDVKNPKVRTAQDVVGKFTSDDDVIAIGDVFFADVERDQVMQPGGPIAHQCKTMLEPHRLILLTAQRFIQTFLGKDFIALHFRRHGFLKFCNAKKPSCFYPVPQAAECINRVVERAGSPVIFLSTDAAVSETGLLQTLITWNGKTVPLIRRPGRNSAEKWDALLYRHGLEDDPQVEAMLDKAICALSTVFIGSSGSTFTEDILRLRKDWGSASLCDEYLCQGEYPNFIAEDE
ncbi:hypothetical protein F511_09906 [Dorcoceras hygrometricum]|uniref:O-fucosyltransferase family protein n=1 Tax=Dorcoceras hygrometricum TaxID=472368 RepID=A0A2Z7CG15_9LAMI|nr:hypothetical protein F511_09906 [Dorcoceras hygrometricum]